MCDGDVMVCIVYELFTGIPEGIIRSSIVYLIKDLRRVLVTGLANDLE